MRQVGAVLWLLLSVLFVVVVGAVGGVGQGGEGGGEGGVCEFGVAGAGWGFAL